ncbi:hypothetical protein ACA910_017448 [Epithemia clementina (nom. ined.)]
MTTTTGSPRSSTHSFSLSSNKNNHLRTEFSAQSSVKDLAANSEDATTAAVAAVAAAHDHHRNNNSHCLLYTKSSQDTDDDEPDLLPIISRSGQETRGQPGGNR